MEQSATIGALAAALAKAQGEFKPVAMNATNPFLHNRYADLGAVIETSKSILAKNGLSVSQCVVGENGTVGVSTILMHSSGEWLSSSVSLPLGEEKGKSMAQVAGSIVTYLRRYSLASILGLYADEDTDGGPGNSNGPGPRQQQAPARPTPREVPAAPQQAQAPQQTQAPKGTPIQRQTSFDWANDWVKRVFQRDWPDLAEKRGAAIKRMGQHLTADGQIAQDRLRPVCACLQSIANNGMPADEQSIWETLDVQLIHALTDANGGELLALKHLADDLADRRAA